MAKPQYELPHTLNPIPIVAPVRSYGICECGCGYAVTDDYERIEWDKRHFITAECFESWLIDRGGMIKVNGTYEWEGYIFPDWTSFMQYMKRHEGLQEVA